MWKKKKTFSKQKDSGWRRGEDLNTEIWTMGS
jgi:hypothetical protein